MTAQLLIDALEVKIDRVKYHDDAVTMDDLDHLLAMAREVERDTVARESYDDAVQFLQDINRLAQDAIRKALL